MDYDEFEQNLLVELVQFSIRNNVLDELKNSIPDDINDIVIKIRDSRINSIIDEK
jgi:hypothetical protein